MALIIQGGVVAVRDANLGALLQVGVTARPKTAVVSQVLTWQPDGSLWEAVFGPNAPAVFVNGGSLAIIGLPGDAALRLASALAVNLGKDVATVTLSSASNSFSWTIDTPTGRTRMWAAADGVATVNEGVPAAEEGGVWMLGQDECLELIRRRTGIVIHDGETAIPVDMGPLAGMAAAPPAPSWRESTPQPVQDDMDLLVDQAFQLATQLLEKNGQVGSFAFGMGIDGKVAVVDVYDGAPDTLTHLASLYEALGSARDQNRCVAVVTDVTVNGGDALCVTIEHSFGRCMNVYLPYRKARFGTEFRYGDLFNGQAEPLIWV